MSTISTTGVVSKTTGIQTHTFSCGNKVCLFASVRSPNAHILALFSVVGTLRRNGVGGMTSAGNFRVGLHGVGAVVARLDASPVPDSADGGRLASAPPEVPCQPLERKLPVDYASPPSSLSVKGLRETKALAGENHDMAVVNKPVH